ncbi:MAG: hypothetical protein N2Z21_10180 [Candidatus Sumerlaeaceae bacterium]|nr:hypothetical protein [Candidatus Sumerlaeaceae bacterium]
MGVSPRALLQDTTAPEQVYAPDSADVGALGVNQTESVLPVKRWLAATAAREEDPPEDRNRDVREPDLRGRDIRSAAVLVGGSVGLVSVSWSCLPGG